MAVFTSPKVEEFFNHVHGPKDGRFASSRYKSGAGKGLFSIAKTSKRGPKHSLLGFKPRARQSFMSEKVEEFYNQFHSKRDGKFTSSGAPSGHAGFREGSHSSGSRTVTAVSPKGRAVAYRQGGERLSGGARSKVGGHGTATPENFPRGDKRVGPTHSKATNARPGAGKVVTGAKLPLRNAVTGRINPTAVRMAFKTTGFKSAGSKRTEHIGATPVTSKTVKGRKISHVVTGGKPIKPMGMGHRWTAAKHKKTVKAQVSLSARAEEFYNKSHDPKSGRFANGSGAYVPSNIKDPSHRAAYQIMKNRELRQQKLAQTNRARANYGMKPITD